MVFGHNLYRANDSKKKDRGQQGEKYLTDQSVGLPRMRAFCQDGRRQARTAGNNEENSDGLPSTSHAVVMAVSHEAHTSAASFQLY
jgi:hypothetical protein